MTFEEQVIKLVHRIPPARVATYGQIAALAGSPRAARQVGWILARTDQALPWHRVINSKGQISIVNLSFPPKMQAELIRGEGVEVIEKDNSFCVDLGRYLWSGG